MNTYEYSLDDSEPGAAALAAVDAGDDDLALDILGAMAGDEPDTDVDLDDYSPHGWDKDTLSRLQDTDRADYDRMDVPQTLVEYAMPGLYSGSARVRTQTEALLQRAAGVGYMSDSYNRIQMALADLLASQGLHPNSQRVGASRQVDDPSLAELSKAWDARYGKPTRQRAEGGAAKEYRPSRP